MFQKIVGWINKALSAIGAGILAVLMLVTGADVVGRYLLHRPIVGVYEISELAMASIVLLGWGNAQTKKSHIDIDLLYVRMPRGIRIILDFLIPSLGIVLFFFIGWQSINFVSDSISWHEVTDMLNIPVWIFKLLMFFGSAAISLQFISDIVSTCHGLTGC